MYIIKPQHRKGLKCDHVAWGKLKPLQVPTHPSSSIKPYPCDPNSSSPKGFKKLVTVVWQSETGLVVTDGEPNSRKFMMQSDISSASRVLMTLILRVCLIQTFEKSL